MVQAIINYQAQIDSCRLKENGYSALESLATFLKVSLVASLIFIAAHFFPRWHLNVGEEVGGCALGLTLGGYGFDRLCYLSTHSFIMKKFYKAGANAYVYKASSQMPEISSSKKDRLATRLGNLQGYLENMACAAKTALLSCFSKDLPGITFVSSANQGKWRDMARYDASIRCDKLAEVGAKFKFTVAPVIETDPFGRGVCFGSCLYFAKTYFSNGQDGHKVAQEFMGGAPVEAVILQEQYAQMGRSLFNGSAVEKSHNQMVAAAELAGLKFEPVDRAQSKEETVQKLIALSDGVYRVCVKGSSSGLHATLLIKKGNEALFFDPDSRTAFMPATSLEAYLKQVLPNEGGSSIAKLTPALQQ